ncbi:uncharacterized protein LOC111023073 isoform X2 [Momordica charantia]|uniref:Uncharacterized protein LOC111023073 isoform X2 n=1 Tax=Momordica charantia TaxID=3673 RepID=A0A6J1DTU7_MOMCH|nr:uncharacterized protein LOC111023073 isoform X2 [Momordica charantia]
MFAVHVDTVMDLRTALLPLVHMSRKADLKCSSDKLSITVVPDQFPFVVSLHLAPSFFTSFQFLPEGDEFEEYSSRFFLDLFISNLSNVPDDSITMTMFLRAHPGIAPLKFVIPSTGYLQYSALVLSPPLNIGIDQIDYRVFVAIHSYEFVLILTRLLVLTNETVRIKLTKSKVKISAQSGEVVLKPKPKFEKVKTYQRNCEQTRMGLGAFFTRYSELLIHTDGMLWCRINSV